MNLNELAKRVHAANIKWWQDPKTGLPIRRNRLELLALVVSEISECLEGERKNLMDDKLPNRRMAEVEMADTYIRLLDYSAGFGLNLFWHDGGWIPDNRGEALFLLTAMVVKIDSDYPGAWISHSLAFIRCYCEKYGYDLEAAIAEKMEFNRTREDHRHEARLIAGGKQF